MKAFYGLVGPRFALRSTGVVRCISWGYDVHATMLGALGWGEGNGVEELHFTNDGHGELVDMVVLIRLLAHRT